MAALLESEGPAGPPVPAFFDDTTPMSGPQLSTPGAGPFLLSPRDYLADMLKAFDFCLPTTGKAVPDRPDWLHEIKYAAIASVWSPTASAFARSPSSAPPEMQNGDAELAPPS